MTTRRDQATRISLGRRNRSALLGRRRGERGAAMLEFVLLIPMFLFLIMFIFDVSHVMMVNGVMQDATYRAARAGATYGGAEPGDGTEPARDAFTQTLIELPGGGNPSAVEFRVLTGQRCTAASPHVEVEAVVEIDMITPGLASLINVTAGLPGDGVFRLRSTALARCEIGRP